MKTLGVIPAFHLSHEIKFWRAKEEETGFARRVQTKRPVMELFPNWLEALEEVA